jgi:hypothetical protein
MNFLDAQSDSRERISSKERIMCHCATTLIAGIVATVLVGGIAMSIPAEAAKLSKAERVALEKATAACREEAKAMKLSWHWLKHRKYVKNCIIRTAVRVDPGIDIGQIRRAVDMKSLRSQRPGEWGCDPMC